LGQRLDKWLVYARFVKHRSLAAHLIEDGKVRVNRERAQKCSYTVKPDDVLTIALGENIKVIRVLGEAEKRGPASDARQLYQDLTCVEKADATGKALC
jgi:ribosome-associated heat shock protein Hsp15